MIELTVENAAEYLCRDCAVTALGGGVSNTVLLAECGEHPGAERFVVKQSLAKLRVEQDWFSERQRIFREAEALRLLAEILPSGSIPRVISEDRDNFIFVMSAAPPRASTWKSLLFEGNARESTAERIGQLLGTMIRGSHHSATLERAFGDQTVFDQLRIDPYYRTTAVRHPDLAPRFQALIDRSARRRVSLVHGDWSPKNFLVDEDNVMAIDFEVVHYGDPSFDAAFLLNHLLLKSLNLPALAASMRALARRFWTALMSTLGSGWDWFEAATIEHLGCLLLARVDGKSPVEYITRHEEKESVRNLARRIILEPPQSIADIFPWESGAGWHPARRLPPAGVPTLRIAAVHALEILDSRGNPTVSVSMELSDGTRGAAQVPSGASTGKHEAVELRDGDPDRYAGKGVLRAVASVNEILGPAIRGMDAEDQKALDARLIEIDGTPDKSRLGANAILGISCAAARAVACSRRIPLWRSLPSGQKPMLPTPMVNMISGGLHAGRRIEVQDFLVVPRGFSTLGEALEAIVKIHRATEGVLLEQGYTLTGVADEGGWGPALESNEAALQVLADGIDRTGFEERFSIAIDVAASHFHQDGRYELSSENRTLSSGEMIEMFERWIADYPVTSIEDGLEEDDWHGWRVLTHKIGSRVQLVGDDLFTTNPSRLHYGIGIGAANAVLVKMNQIGTLTETFRVVDLARRAGYTAVISARSGETEDSFLADLAVACGSGQIKIGSVTRSERLSKYNRLLEIERELARA